MQPKTSKRPTLSKVKKSPNQHKSNGVVEAVLIQPPNLSLYLKLQNLLNYFVDCMNNLTSIPENYMVWSDHFTRCINFITDLDSAQKDTFDDELHRMLQEFIEDAQHFQELLASLNEPTLTRTKDQTAAVLLTAKASHLQWLSVCILEDLKKTYTHS